jgi:ParB-like chromosome segregation protein Spo0J
MIKKLLINEIRPTKNPVRQTRDEEKIKELAQSISEKGVLQPIKVRPVEFDGTTKYEIVFGARRWEAASLAGLKTISAIVEEMEDSEVIAEGLVENIQKEDMLDIDIAIAASEYLHNKTGLSVLDYVNKDNFPPELASALKKLASILGVSRNHLKSKYLKMLSSQRKPIVDEFYKTNPNVKDVKTKAEWLQQAAPNEDIETQKAIARKAVKEELGQRRVKEVAQAVANAESPEHKAKILESSYEQIVKEPTFIKAQARQEQKQKKQQVKKQQGYDKIVKAHLEAIQIFNDAIDNATLAAKYDKFSPEAKKFTIRKHLSLIENIKKLNMVLGEENE